MNIWANTVLTDKGRALLAKLTQGNTLNITKAVTGAGFVTPGFLAKQTEVTDPKQTLEIRPASYPETGTCALTVALRNESLTVGYEATQVGIYATDPDEGEILFFISQATAAGSGTTIPSGTEMASYSAEWTFYFQYGQADSVNVTVDPAGSVSRADVEAMVSAKVDKVAGKGLSTNDYTTAEKEKLASISEGANLRYEYLNVKMPANNIWYSVTYGDGKFVAVSSKKIAYSTDGVIWEVVTLTGTTWRYVAYGYGKFVVVATNSADAAYSADGVTWVQVASCLPSIATWSGVTYGGGKFVVVAANSTDAAYSTDGITWIAATLPRDASWQSVAYGDGKFVAVATKTTDRASAAAYSTDGITWKAATLPGDADWKSVAYGDGKFVAVSSETIAYSTDGITWKEATLTGTSWCRVAYGDGKFVVVATESTDAAYSTDGITWKEATLPRDASWQSVAYGDGKFVVAAMVSRDAAYSTDGITWKTELFRLLKDGSNVGEGVMKAIGAAPAYTYGTEDLVAGVSDLKTGTLYFVYE